MKIDFVRTTLRFIKANIILYRPTLSVENKLLSTDRWLRALTFFIVRVIQNKSVAYSRCKWDLTVTKENFVINDRRNYFSTFSLCDVVKKHLNVMFFLRTTIKTGHCEYCAIHWIFKFYSIKISFIIVYFFLNYLKIMYLMIKCQKCLCLIIVTLFFFQLISTPFAYGSIYLGPTGAMVTLAISYLFGKSDDQTRLVFSC